MSRSGFIEFEAAIAVARFRNFRAAAADLGMSPTALSSTIRGLEARIGVQIFSRTTRSVALTAAGNAFIERISSSVADINEAIRIAQGHATDPTGALRINSSITAAHEILTPLIQDFLNRNPGVSIDLVTNSRLVDIVLEGFDAGIRTASSVPGDMIAIPLGRSLDFVVLVLRGTFQRILHLSSRRISCATNAFAHGGPAEAFIVGSLSEMPKC